MSALASLQDLIGGVRRCFQLLGSLSDEMVADLGITAALRAVLEHLYDGGPQTVPQIARDKSVRRQSIQALVDELLELGLVELLDNPTHKRSALAALTPEGRALFREVRRRERRSLARLVKGFEAQELAAASTTLAKLRDRLRPTLEGMTDDAA